jgi:methyl-accepting chemotaxis protein
MKNWTIGKRVTSGFVAILAILAIIAFSLSILLKQIKAHQQDVLNDALPGISAAGQVKYLACEIQLSLSRAVSAKSADDRKKFEDEVKAQTGQIQKVLDDYEKTIARTEDREQFNRVMAARDAYTKAREPLLEANLAGNDAEVQKLLPAVRSVYDAYLTECDGLFDENTKFGNTAASASQKAMSLANTLTITLTVIGISVGILLSYILVRGVTRTLVRISVSLDEGSKQVASAAGQVSSSSQSLAEGASEQAASLEETSSSLEEMASMTKRNSENAQKANDLAKEARTAADKGAADMLTMNTAMEAIKTSSDDIAKIIKTIDEIAFQTNILALNAAVEAARAGEAGMGFAVVADEVRNLAQRSAQAAKETAGKIEGAISKTTQGVDVSGKVATALKEIVTKVRQVDELVAEVAGASREQTQGITQINTAVSQMDKVTQSNAASAEESRDDESVSRGIAATRGRPGTIGCGWNARGSVRCQSGPSSDALRQARHRGSREWPCPPCAGHRKHNQRSRHHSSRR